MLYVIQRTNGHVVKALDTTQSPAVYVNHFGIFGSPGSTLYQLNFPTGIAVDFDGNFYICDKTRVVKLDNSLNYIDEYITTSTIGEPFAIIFDSLYEDLYISGIYDECGENYVRIERINTSLESIKVSSNLNILNSLWFHPTGLCRGTEENSFLISGANRVVSDEIIINNMPVSGTQVGSILKTIENEFDFSFATEQNIEGEFTTFPKVFLNTVYNSIIQHHDGNFYLNNGRKLLRVDDTYTNAGDSDQISKTINGLKEGLFNSLITYNVDTQTVIRYNTNLNFVENIYSTTGNTVETSAYDITDFVEFSIESVPV